MNIHDLIQAEADDLTREFEGHDPWAFTRRLAERIADGERPSPARSAARSERTPAAPRPAGNGRPARRGVTEAAGAAGRAELRRDLQHLCVAVASEASPDALASFIETCDETAALAFGCLLYGLGNRPAAEFWWGFAHGAEDKLAAHLLAVHHAGSGHAAEADLWKHQAQELEVEQLPDGLEALSLEDAAATARALTAELDTPTRDALRELEFLTTPVPPPVPGPMPERRVSRGRSPRRRTPIGAGQQK
ncbi:hypothetical protein [Kitasatospora sp. NPDC093679]|uniref:hypothetical protein n=1 Tax=Kitasatospora sp. NPDC093679 TaxID=3154983 RepID=UPI0034418768